jgi:phenylpropionate dioxygenase-like ring-hydroxylating dioxygenase large terminal subunit
MSEKFQNLNGPYSAYLSRGVPDEDAELTHVGPGTPCGEYFRRFWQPVGFSAKLGDLPRRIRILGEDLVLFRDGGGRVGLLQLHCSHRGTSLEFGRIAERGIRCCYHGWHFDVDGRILDTPGEPADSKIKERLWHGAYPTREYGGLVFAYMGPPERKPPFPILDTFVDPDYELIPGGTHVIPCNWLQVKENSMDPIHTVFLHTVVNGTQFTESFGDLGTIDFLETPVGMLYIHSRRVGDNIWIHVSDFLPPNIHQFGATWEDGTQVKRFQRPMITNWSVPVDDTHTMSIGMRHVAKNLKGVVKRRNAQEESVETKGFGFGQAGDRPYEERQRVPGDYDAQVGQRDIARHAAEHLGTTDRGVAMLRRMLRKGIREVQNGQDPAFLCREEGKLLLTYANDTVVRIPHAGDAEADKALLRDTGRKVVEEYLRCHPMEASKVAL